MLYVVTVEVNIQADTELTAQKRVVIALARDADVMAIRPLKAELYKRYE